MRVALVVMPFSSESRPSLAAGLLEAALSARGIPCDVHYPSIDLARQIGPERYRTMAEEIPDTALAGEWVFAQALHGPGLSTWETYSAEVLAHPALGVREDLRPLVREVAGAVPSFLARTLESTDWGRYDLVGFTSTFQQTLASLCLARAIRERHPHVRIAAGGANLEAPMGRVYLERYPFLDYVANGEGDVSFPALCDALREGRPDVPAGILSREGARVVPERDEPAPPAELDALPVPDFSDFFRAREEAFPGRKGRVYVSVEASRGCWWGQVSHCTFCGLNGGTMAYRRKSAARVAEEARRLVAAQPGVHLMFADNILDERAFDELVPGWAERGDPTPKFFEVKPTLTRSKLALLAAAGVTEVQAGIESLSDGSLRVMRKGLGAARNVAFLRWCAELGIAAHWNLIYGSPRERAADYAETLALARTITHLPPPCGAFRIRVDRFSPNHADWQGQGFSAIRPLPAYRHLHPFPEDDLARLAYYFEHEVPNEEVVREASGPLIELVARWRQAHAGPARPVFAVRRHLDGSLVLLDERPGREPLLTRLDDLRVACLLSCDAPTSREAALRAVAAAFPGTPAGERERALEWLLDVDALALAGRSLVTIPLLPFDLRAGGLHRHQGERTVEDGRRKAAILVGR
jgi:ribosomal peptide maturation radical SAM protein 1